MFIPEFWCGVIATILSQFIALVVATVIRGKKKK